MEKRVNRMIDYGDQTLIYHTEVDESLINHTEEDESFVNHNEVDRDLTDHNTVVDESFSNHTEVDGSLIGHDNVDKSLIYHTKVDRKAIKMVKTVSRECSMIGLDENSNSYANEVDRYHELYNSLSQDADEKTDISEETIKEEIELKKGISETVTSRKMTGIIEDSNLNASKNASVMNQQNGGRVDHQKHYDAQEINGIMDAGDETSKEKYDAGVHNETDTPAMSMMEVDEYSNPDAYKNVFATGQNGRVAKRVAEEARNGKTNWLTKIKCPDTTGDSKRRRVRSNEVEALFCDTLDQFEQMIEIVMRKHCDKIDSAKKQLETFVEKHTDESTNIVAEYEKHKLALEDKLKELELQKNEFTEFSGNCISDLVRAKASPSFERCAEVVRFKLDIEYNRLCNALPIYAKRSEILATVRSNPVCVVIGETGSGKSTQIAQYLYQDGLASEGKIVCTQPRTIAVSNLAIHVAKELGSCVGQLVGYKVGMQCKQSSLTRVVYMTDYLLLNECLKDRELSKYSCIIIDEAHERTIHSDLLLGMIKQCLNERPDLRVVITSATINPEVFVNYFHHCPVLHVSGQMYPVDVEWQETHDDDPFENYVERALVKAIEIHLTQPKGDILVFLTKPQETELSCLKFQEKMESLHRADWKIPLRERLREDEHMMKGKDLDYVTIALHGRLQAEEQQKVFEPTPPGKRKIVFATNCAETSITIPSIRYVVDSGMVKEMKFDAERKMSTLMVTMVTQSTARQRMGRSGRLGPGKCYRLYSKYDFDRMTVDSVPEIHKVHLGRAMLKLMELGVDPLAFDYIDTPSRAAMEDAFTSLVHIGAVKDGKITEAGKWIAKLPLDPQYGAFVYEAVKVGLGLEAIVVSAASGMGPLFYREGTEEEKELADQRKMPFCHEGGDQLTMLNVFRNWHQVDEREKGRWCAENYINGKVVRAVRETTNIILKTLKKQLNEEVKFIFSQKEKVDAELPGLLFRALDMNLGYCLGSMRAGYIVVTKNQRIEIHRSSALWSLGYQPQWVVFDKVLKTCRAFAINVASITESVVKAGIEEGRLHLQIDEAKKRINIACVENVGLQMFREIVGPCFVDFRRFESELIANNPDSIVVVEADKEKRQLRVLASNDNMTDLTGSFANLIELLRAKYEAEESEEVLGQVTERSTRAVLGAGGSTLNILMPGESNDVLINCSLAIIDQLTEEEIKDKFSDYGKIKQCTKFTRKSKFSTLWGKVVYEDQEGVFNAIESTRKADIIAHPNNRVRSTFRLEWCRRPFRYGFVYFANDKDLTRAAKLGSIDIGECCVSVKPDKNNKPKCVYVSGLNKLAEENDLREAFAAELGIDASEDISEMRLIRDTVSLDDPSLQEHEEMLIEKIREFSEKSFHLEVKRPRTEKDSNYLAYCCFINRDEGLAACAAIDQKMKLGGHVVSMKPDIHSSVLIHRDVFLLHNKEIENQLEQIEMNQISVKRKTLRNGNLVLDFRGQSAEALVQARSNLQELVKGEVLEFYPLEMVKLLSLEGQHMLQDIMKTTQTSIIADERVMTVSIHGNETQRKMAREQIEEYADLQSTRNFEDLELMGAGKPAGVMKAIMMKYHSNLNGLRIEAELSDVRLDLKLHRVRLYGSKKAIVKAKELVMQVSTSLSMEGSLTQDGRGTECVICFNPVESKDLYRLEFCGHAYCNQCVDQQVTMAIKCNKFPIECESENCSGKFVWRDFKNFTQLGYIMMTDLVSASVRAYVAMNKNIYSFCLSTDCPAVYRKTQTGELFECSECNVRLCTSCHDYYHDEFTCAEYRTSYKRREDDLTAFTNIKKCSNCGNHIEKEIGCNVVRCLCKKYICWSCMQNFDTEIQCYEHIQLVHGDHYGESN